MNYDALLTVLRENPCRWPAESIDSVVGGMVTLLSSKDGGGVSMMNLAEYYHVTIRTLQRWRKRYADFPRPADPYAKVLSFNPLDVVEWKQRHKELF